MVQNLSGENIHIFPVPDAKVDGQGVFLIAGCQKYLLRPGNSQLMQAVFQLFLIVAGMPEILHEHSAVQYDVGYQALLRNFQIQIAGLHRAFLRSGQNA